MLVLIAVKEFLVYLTHQRLLHSTAFVNNASKYTLHSCKTKVMNNSSKLIFQNNSNFELHSHEKYTNFHLTRFLKKPQPVEHRLINHIIHSQSTPKCANILDSMHKCPPVKTRCLGIKNPHNISKTVYIGSPFKALLIKET